MPRCTRHLVAEDSLARFCIAFIHDPKTYEAGIRDREYEIYRADPNGLSLEEAKASSDPVLREWAEKLDESWSLYDLRPGQHLRGFSRARLDEILKHPTELIFARRYTAPEPTRPWWKLW